ncbi:hypothetical protein [Streptomyces poonensis]|uniref:Uncharacterized protein n=1 Tax=Streptomyces poonensis TaxID=68255 RepID=A0A918PX35_9ACTN|nr:hypothetical protein [Streptomyces poonensis]GGZ25928.1 hypothetical protein GCM10010365_52770 [Streptomyces poonensis]GLJ89060.1 hypothetical protein GCM10017589_16600 [Streptomyces poonensis]
MDSTDGLDRAHRGLWPSLRAHYVTLDPEEKEQPEHLATVRAVYQHPVTRDGFPYVGIAFDCLRDPERGVGAIMHGNRVVHLGGAEVAAEAGIAERDAADPRTGLDEALIGHWSSDPFDYGVLECSDLELRADGTGWSSVSNAFTEDVDRLTWGCPEPGVLELRSPEGDVIRHRYVVGPAVPVHSAEPVMSVTFEEPVAYSYQYGKWG